MPPFKSVHRTLTIRGRPMHFETRAGRAADFHRAQLAYPPMWYLVVEGNVCPAFPCDPDLSDFALDVALRDWAEDNALGPVEGPAFPPPPAGLTIA